LFAARTHIYATRIENSRTGWNGWLLAVRGGWRRGVPHEKRDDLPPTTDLVAGHLKGDAQVGVYPLLDGDRCWWLAADFDGPDAATRLHIVRSAIHRGPALRVVAFEEAEPGFADGGKTGDGVPEPADGDLAGHGDGGRVNQLFHAGADEGDAEQVAVILVDDHAGAAGVAVGVQARPG
jgi:hypothetical protein